MLPRMSGPATTTVATPSSISHTEITETVKLALPMALTQLGQIAMMTTDLALIGRLGDLAVAAVALAHLILFCGLLARLGPGVSRCSVGRPGLWGAPTAPGAALAPHGALGRRNRRPSGQCGAALGRRYPARSRSIPGNGRACGTLPLGT